jgi:hypothetical protein
LAESISMGRPKKTSRRKKAVTPGKLLRGQEQDPSQKPRADKRQDGTADSAQEHQISNVVVPKGNKSSQIKQLLHDRLYDVKKHPETALRGNTRLLL